MIQINTIYAVTKVQAFCSQFVLKTQIRSKKCCYFSNSREVFQKFILISWIKEMICFFSGRGVSVLHFYIILCAYKRLFKKLINVNSFVTMDIFGGAFFGHWHFFKLEMWSFPFNAKGEFDWKKKASKSWSIRWNLNVWPFKWKSLCEYILVVLTVIFLYFSKFIWKWQWKCYSVIPFSVFLLLS